MVAGLAAQGVVAVAATFVDNSGITRVKAVPLERLPHLAAWGVGISTSFDYFRFDDWIAAPPGGHAPVGDLRIIPDVRRGVPLVAPPGWGRMAAGRARPAGMGLDARGQVPAVRRAARALQPPSVAAAGRRPRGHWHHGAEHVRDRV